MSRRRWVNYLDPSIKSEEWTSEEERRMFAFQAKFGNKWSEIAKELDGRYLFGLARPYNCIKNHFYSALRKGLRKINIHIQTRFRRSEARPVSPHFLSKVLLLAEEGDKVQQARRNIQLKCVGKSCLIQKLKRKFIFIVQGIPLQPYWLHRA